MLNFGNYFVMVFLWYVSYNSCIILWNLARGIRQYLLPNSRFFRQVNLVGKYGSWAVITGSSDGIGKEYAKELAKRGLNVVLISRTQKKLEKIASEIENKYHVKTKIIVADFNTDETVYERVKIELENIPIGILVNNVGTCTDIPEFFVRTSSQDIWKILRVNVATTLFMTKIVLPQMQQRRKGAIVNLSSAMELAGVPLSSVYSSSKAFIRNFSQALRVECEVHGITIQVLAPVFVKTNINTYICETWIDKFLAVRAKDYARYAINTLGVVNHSTGYWAHGFQYFCIDRFPKWIFLPFVRFTSKKLRASGLKKRNVEKLND